MEITCDQCQSKFNLPDEKVPKGKTFTLGCPKCKNKIQVSAPADEPEPASGGGGFDEEDSGYDASERPFDFIEEGAKTALICDADPVNREKLVEALKNLDYHVTHPPTARDALKQMRFHVFDLIVVNENFDTPDPDQNNVLRYLSRLPMGIRRNIFVAMVTDRYRTNDTMMAFVKSVNMVINMSNLDDAEKIIKRNFSEFEMFYRVFKESMVKTGRA